MKTIILVISVVTIFTFNGLSQTTKASQLLENKDERTETFNAILNNHELMMGFMEAMKGNKHAMMMMKGDNQMMEKDGNMEMTPDQIDKQNEHKMMGMVKDDPEMMKKMMGNMLEMSDQDSDMCNSMANMMTDHPKMMQMCMKKMDEKGMMGTDGKMKMKKSTSPEIKKHH